ncbi:MAG: homoserine O-succinyltransferase [Leuconostoc gelidum]|uniref:homoserine O-acetyltransferase/O-succinyltransferase family protein n=1 Tax=Leuconostoc gelidum TaxID=1244 RepID=UPI0015757DB2|nr:homoserine O-succinyltransferase [Leuconostoc gelidum]MBZ5979150.1 homoserine O-succinyltransferase [Leuconostoc gelidum subsp. gelidum]MBZ6002000.1 homoserine O-succinyltransferase [Leuconostoc gelidum subsp. gelidum]QDJ30411.1 homoserine O-succinyltransferase [Leuconostoc gelidum subsp. gelidum]
MSVILQNGLLKRERLTLGTFKILQPTLNVLVVNLMPNRLQTERQFAQLLTHLSVNVRVTYAIPASHHIKNNAEVVKENYDTFEDIWQKKYDGLIVTGAPVDRIKFETIDYWQEFQQLLIWRKTHVSENLFTCWSAYGAGYAERNFPVRHSIKKVYGVYHVDHILNQRSQLTADLTQMTMPQSRYFTIPNEGIARRLKVAGNDLAGAFILRDERARSTYITGHLEYDTTTLEDEYQRDIKKDASTQQPKNYYVNGQPHNNWQKSAEKIFFNWGQLLIAGTQCIEMIDLLPALKHTREGEKTG